MMNTQQHQGYLQGIEDYHQSINHTERIPSNQNYYQLGYADAIASELAIGDTIIFFFVIERKHDFGLKSRRFRVAAKVIHKSPRGLWMVDNIALIKSIKDAEWQEYFNEEMELCKGIKIIHINQLIGKAK